MRSRSITLAFATVSALLFVAQTAGAAAQTVATRRTELAAMAKKQNIAMVERKAPNGHKRIYVNVTKQKQMDAMDVLLGQGKDVLQILHHGAADSMHTLAMFDGELIHLQTPDHFQNWQLNVWGRRLRETGSKIYSAFIHLDKDEGANLRTRIARARQQQAASPRGVFGDALGKRGMNCASGWCGLPIGKGNSPLYKLIGLHYENGSPQDFQHELEHDANDRVFGLAVYGKALPKFATNLPATVFNFDE